MAKGKVTLVGAGPWDPGLLTLKGRERLEEAEVVLYDDLVNPSLLRYAPKEAKKIYVGKRGGIKSTSQEKIHRLLLKFAKEGKKIVRLKGGDPLLFGRASEELLTLAKHKILFEVVPGVSSAVACPAYAGIPISDRHYASSVGIITGTERPDKETSSLRWGKLATGVDTLVVLMGVRMLPEIVEKLIKNGRSPKTPCALIRWGTSSRQNTITGTLATIVRASRRITPPAVFVVGEVVRLRRFLNWYESKPLFGKRILVTRPKGQAEQFARILEEKGAEVLTLPTGEIMPLGKEREWRALISSLSTYDWCFFNSVNGVALFLIYWEKFGGSLKGIAHVKIAAIGPKTKEALEKGNLTVSLLPRRFTQEGLVGEIRKRRIELRGKKVLLFHAEGARTFLSSSLKKRGASVKVIRLYGLKKTSVSAKSVLETLRRGGIDIITFTSSSCVDYFFDFFPGVTPKALIDGTAVASIGPVTSKRCRDLGLRVSIEAKRHTTEGLLEAMINPAKGK
ncbi:MAG: uroporphyrinogen-III C-methyltransferase [Candidatus Omnitrophica bacterium]|nr:uroporphyrinogen-III C-methyltransferase [Candidatus Omnitrophota bacterium]